MADKNYLKTTHDELIRIFNAPPIQQRPAFAPQSGRMIRPPQNMPVMPKGVGTVPQVNAPPAEPEQPVSTLRAENPFAFQGME